MQYKKASSEGLPCHSGAAHIKIQIKKKICAWKIAQKYIKIHFVLEHLEDGNSNMKGAE